MTNPLLSDWLRSFLIAVQFLTSIPVMIRGEIQPQDNGRAVVFYPLVGLILGSILYVLFSFLEPSGLSAAITLTIWVTLTGALHLDGLADSADAWMGGHADRERTLTIMKDPTAGPVAVVTLILVLLLKWAALQHMIETNTLSIVFSLILARMMVVALLMTTPYARENGLAAEMQQNLPKKVTALVLLGCTFLLLLMDWKTAVTAMITAVLITLYLRHMMLKRINGFTGDTAGALIEMVELGVLVSLVVID